LDQLRELADGTGRFVVVAIDHRGNLRTALSDAARREVDADELTAFKRAVVRKLSAGCSAALLDPEYGLAAAPLRAPNCGLLLAYEKSGYDNSRPGRRPDLLRNQSVLRLKEAGAQAIKILLHFSGMEDSTTKKRLSWNAWVRNARRSKFHFFSKSSPTIQPAVCRRWNSLAAARC
jgi:tagatose 1,6-diphosphate aldolase